MSDSNPYRSIYHDTDALLAAMQREVRKALRRHKLLGNPIAVMDEHDNVVIVQPEDIEVPDED